MRSGLFQLLYWNAFECYVRTIREHISRLIARLTLRNETNNETAVLLSLKHIAQQMKLAVALLSTVLLFVFFSSFRSQLSRTIVEK